MAERERTVQSLLLYYLVVVLSITELECNQTGHSCNGGNHGTNVLREPKLLVFNLDKVIWPFTVDRDVVTPVKKSKKTGRVQDFVLKDLGVYGHALDLLSSLYLKKYRMAAISDSPDVETYTKLMLYFNLYNYFPIQEIFCAPKKSHLNLIHGTTQVPYDQMFYFDVKNDQLDGLRCLGVHIVQVNTGVEMKDFDRAMEIYNNLNISLRSTLPTPQ